MYNQMMMVVLMMLTIKMLTHTLYSSEPIYTRLNVTKQCNMCRSATLCQGGKSNEYADGADDDDDPTHLLTCVTSVHRDISLPLWSLTPRSLPVIPPNTRSKRGNKFSYHLVPSNTGTHAASNTDYITNCQPSS